MKTGWEVDNPGFQRLFTSFPNVFPENNLTDYPYIVQHDAA